MFVYLLDTGVRSRLTRFERMAVTKATMEVAGLHHPFLSQADRIVIGHASNSPCWTSKRGIWVWLKIKPPGDRRFWSMVPFTRVPFWVPHMFIEICADGSFRLFFRKSSVPAAPSS